MWNLIETEFRRKKMRASPIRIPTVSNDTDWDFCFHLPKQTKIPAHQRTDGLCPISGSGESEEDTNAKAKKAIDCMSFPKEQLAQSQKKIAQLIKEKMNTQANKELIRCVILSRIIFGEEHWKCAQALASLAYGYLTLRGLPAQAKKHADSAKNTLLTWKENTTSDKEKKEIVEALVMLYYTLGVAWLLQNQYPFLPSWVWALLFAYQLLSLLHRVGCVPSIFLDCFTGKEAYFNLQKSDRNMKELKESYKGGVCGLQVSEKDLMIALGRASLVNRRLNLALAYFEKAVGNVIAAKGDRTSDLVILYEEIAQIEQLRRNHEQAIQYLQQVSGLEPRPGGLVWPQDQFPQNRRALEIDRLTTKSTHFQNTISALDAVEIYFIKSITAYQTTLGPEGYETLTTIEDFCKWLIENGGKQEAYRLLKASLKSQVISYGDYSEKVAETFFNMGRICFAKGELRKAIQLLRKLFTFLDVLREHTATEIFVVSMPGPVLREKHPNPGIVVWQWQSLVKAPKCLMIQIVIYGSGHSKSRDTENLLTLLQRSSVISKEKTSIQDSQQ
ncbi:Tetratricopeptide repeat protein 23-like [Camelus dromedarius]|uniref:Tetratricopeptide repeat protein 23-like n=1 Tax=Camelus dromedarius TaxID=9838 RepID=A0A5N4EDM6_CAMDR|nr:Tetratricopeptide repeat protein 23-like [Camelus dromedarius]